MAQNTVPGVQRGYMRRRGRRDVAWNTPGRKVSAMPRVRVTKDGVPFTNDELSQTESRGVARTVFSGDQQSWRWYARAGGSRRRPNTWPPGRLVQRVARRR